ncbi:MAG: hypothetical protein NWE93_02450 [Candidatus Bathyarchaeota archaeon]|nr:hypothetical protein [Candidatus Bathyarchaeota archaeon]
MEYVIVKEVDFPKKQLQGKEHDSDYPSLKDVPLEVRRREAKKPLYLIRYE